MRVAGVILIVLGSLWAAIGAVLVVVALLWSNPTALPNWVEPGTSDAAALARLTLVGVTGLVAGGAQLASGLGVQRSSVGWPAWVGLGTAVFGALVTGAWMVSGLGQGQPALIFLPVVAAYAYTAWALAFGRDR
jgi:hypothetical protein